MKIHVYLEQHTQYPEKFNVWGGIVDEHIAILFFINGNLDDYSYSNLLQDIEPIIPEILEQDENLIEQTLVFQQNGAPLYFIAPIREYPTSRFIDQCIGRRGSKKWP